MSANIKPTDLTAINRSYETDEAVQALSSWYAGNKEKAFIQYAFEGVPIPAAGPIVEIGGGAGLHGLLIQQRFGPRFIHSDYSAALVAQARSLGLESRVVDGLATPFESASVAGLFLVGPSTIVGDEDLRQRQFNECHRILLPGGCAIFVTGRLARTRERHCLSNRDLEILKGIGFEVLSTRYWGAIPGRMWSNSVANTLTLIERIFAVSNMGLRKIVAVRRP